jgi:hypothetical protein
MPIQMQFGSSAWPPGKYVLRLVGRDLQNTFPGQEKPSNTLTLGHMKQARLQEARLDCLRIDGIDVDWFPWLRENGDVNNPRVILWMADEMCIGNDRTGPMSSDW